MTQTRMKKGGKAVSWIWCHSSSLLLRTEPQVVVGRADPGNSPVEYKNTVFPQPSICVRREVSRLISVSGQDVRKTPASTSAHRVILHLDLDCFYAQVEMIRNPALREVPLGKMHHPAAIPFA